MLGLHDDQDTKMKKIKYCLYYTTKFLTSEADTKVHHIILKILPLKALNICTDKQTLSHYFLKLTSTISYSQQGQ